MRTITFYSYKGGTGRTLLLANMAVLAAGLGKKVVARDFDLEAPGLPYKLFPNGPPKADGLVGWLLDTFSGGEPPASLDDYLIDRPVESSYREGGWLKLMPAGRAPSPNYFQDLRRLRLDQRLDDGTAIDALIELQERLANDLGAEFLLIDARTGITSTNAVTTHVLADDVVALALDTPEQLEGTRSILRSVRPFTSLRTDEPLGMHIVLSRLLPRPSDTSIWDVTSGERKQMARVIEFLTEPAQPVTRTLDVDELHLLHTDLALNRSEFLSCDRPGVSSPSVMHVDNLRIARAQFGQEVEDAAVAAMVAAGDDVDRRIELAGFFASPEMLIDARGLRAGERVGDAPPDIGLEQQVEVLSRQVNHDPTLLPDLAALLVSVSSQLAKLGRRVEAVEPIETAVGHYRSLAETNSGRFLPDLAMSLNNLSNRLGEAGRRDAGLAAIEEAVAIRRRLAAAKPAAYEPDLAMSLNNLSNRLRDLGRHKKADKAAAEAEAISRRLLNRR